MHRCIAVAVIVAAMALPGHSQRRGGGFARSSSGMHGGSFAGRAPSFESGARVSVGTGFRTPLRSGGSFGVHRRPFFPNRFAGGRFFRGYPGVYPYISYPYFGYPYIGSYYADPGYDSGYDPSYEYSGPQENFQGYNTSPSYYDNNVQAQQEQINRLEDEVDRLHRERENTAQPAKPEPQPGTLLVFQDKRTEEVQNYAIVGETLWIFNEQRARKVPLDQLDIPATQKANEEKGIDFRLPEPN